MRFFSFIAALPSLVLAASITSPPPGAEVIPGKYIAVFKPEAFFATTIETLVRILGIEPEFTFALDGFRGISFAADLPLLDAILESTAIAYVEQDTVVRTSKVVTQQNAPYGLSLLSHKGTPGTTYTYYESAGNDTFSYIIDTGILTTHPDFGGRASFGANFAGDKSNTDGNGHGTHVAGTTGSTTYGVAKRTNLIAVKVLGSDGSGTNSGVIAGIDWAANDMKSKKRIGKSVANMSLGGGYSEATSSAVAAAVNAGLFMAVAAGNDGVDAANSSPASERSACTVGAIDQTKTEAFFSNYGSVLDIFAPGVDILSTWNDGRTNVISGTSMATPHITGLAAYLLSHEGRRLAPAMCDRIVQLATSGVKSLQGTGTPNKIAYNGNGA